MSSTTRIEGCLPAAGAGSTTGLVFSRGWAVEYDWAADRVATSASPKRVANLGFPPGFQSDLDGVLRGQGAFASFLYIFSGGQYMRLVEATMVVDGGPLSTADNWDLPADWTNLDAVFPGSGKKSGFAYFFRGDEYCRFDWAANKRSAGYPKKIAQEWHTTAPFDRDIDGVLIGQAGFSTKAYVFKTVALSVDDNGAPVPAGTGHAVDVPVYARYDFDAEKTEFDLQDPAQVVQGWNGLMPLLDAGPAVDLAIVWLTASQAGLVATPLPGAVASGLSRHFRVTPPDSTHQTAIATEIGLLLTRLAAIPDRFVYTPGLPVASQSTPGISTEVGDQFSTSHGPNDRVAVLIHESVHFVFVAGTLAIDVPEWSGETIGGATFGIDSVSGRGYASLTADEAVANPSSYAAFAQEAATGTDSRFGAGRPQE